MKNVTPRLPEPYVPHGEDRASYLAGRFDMQLEAAEANHWRAKGFYIDKTTGKLREIEA